MSYQQAAPGPPPNQGLYPQPGYQPQPHPGQQQPQTIVMQTQPMPMGTVIIQQQAAPKPQNYMVLAVLVTFCCNPLFGMIAWIFSCVSDNSYQEGQTEEARKNGKISMWLSVVGIIVSFIVSIIWVVVTVTASLNFVTEFCGNNFHGLSACYSCSACCSGPGSSCTEYQKSFCFNRCL